MVRTGVPGVVADGWAAASGGSAHADYRDRVVEQLTEVRDDGGDRVPRPVSECVTGEADRLVLPGMDVTVTALDCDAQYQLATASELPAGPFLLTGTVETGTGEDPLSSDRLEVVVRFDGPASLRPTCDGTVLSMWEPTRVTVGFRPVASGPPRVQVPRSPAGLARGISAMSAAHRTAGPSRSHPDRRDHPPVLTLGESVAVPDAVADRRHETGIELRLPRDVDALFVGAPLAYYLGATVTVGDRVRPLLTAGDADVRHEFDPLPRFQEQAADLLRRVFYLDCLVRSLKPERDPDLLTACSLTPDAVRSLSPGGRLARYLRTPAETVRAALPEWHLTTHARPSLERARCLPFLLDKLSLVYRSDGVELDHADLLDRTLTDAFPTRGSAPASTRVEPEVGNGRVSAWLAPGTPVDAYKTMPTAYENQYRYDGRDAEHLQVSVVLNDSSMSDEHGDVSDIYQSASLPLDVDVAERLTTAELAATFEADTDFVHFIGHCDDDGLRCPDGGLAAAQLSRSRTRTFFLNACGSYEVGLGLVERGSVAGAVTFADVLDRHAATVGTAFARLLSAGFSIQRALQLARRRIVMGKDYAVVGDGTYALLPSPAEPTVVWVRETADGFDIACEAVTPEAGERHRLPFEGEVALNGRRRELSVSREAAVEALGSVSVPVIYDGEFHWSDDLVSRLDGRP
ncbi:hypothetical protein [Haloarcula litorea]|uniref:hypothetical protein n=1 Tax=Haloarcula litorea TaxID=3032579 RepID=UPI0023E8592C|nr:hypothetical protein [Halomicroarcula sp. GDY20]